MPEQFTGRVQIQTDGEVPTILLNGNSAQIEVGGNGESGSVNVRTDAGDDRVRVVEGGIVIYDDSGQAVIELRGLDGHIRIGTNGAKGELYLENNQGVETIHLGGAAASIELGADGQAGDVSVKNNQGAETVHVGGNDARIELGASGESGDVYVRNDQGVDTIHLGGADARLEVGANGEDGDIFVRNTLGVNTIHLDGTDARIDLGANGQAGDIFVKNTLGVETIHLNGYTAMITVGADGVDGDIYVKNNQGVNTIRLDGQSGDIILENADAAEDFEIADSEHIEPGTVVVIGEDSRLHASDQSYDKRVAGVISGAGELRPGIILGRQASQQSRLPVALMGKVYCKVDATMAPIDVGDLLTTSPTPGHAMKASDPLKAFGTVIGKALGSQPSGTGTIPILVSLQ